MDAGTTRGTTSIPQGRTGGWHTGQRSGAPCGCRRGSTRRDVRRWRRTTRSCPAFWAPMPTKSGGPVTSFVRGWGRGGVEAVLPGRVLAEGMKDRPPRRRGQPGERGHGDPAHAAQSSRCRSSSRGVAPLHASLLHSTSHQRGRQPAGRPLLSTHGVDVTRDHPSGGSRCDHGGHVRHGQRLHTIGGRQPVELVQDCSSTEKFSGRC